LVFGLKQKIKTGYQFSELLNGADNLTRTKNKPVYYQLPLAGYVRTLLGLAGSRRKTGSNLMAALKTRSPRFRVGFPTSSSSFLVTAYPNDLCCSTGWGLEQSFFKPVTTIMEQL
jgi:hypothetical protein